MQDMEFPNAEGKWNRLQTRPGKRTAAAALMIACDMVDEGLITPSEAVAMIDPKQLDALLHPQFDAAALKAANPIGKGLPASPGAACGQVVFTADDAAEWGKNGSKVILVRLETSPEDRGNALFSGYSHVGRYDIPCGGCCQRYGNMLCFRMRRVIDEEAKKFTLAEESLRKALFLLTEMQYIRRANSTVMLHSGNFDKRKWADEIRTMKAEPMRIHPMTPLRQENSSRR